MVLWGKAGASDLSLGWGTATELYSEHELPSVFLGIEGAVDENRRRVPVISSIGFHTSTLWLWALSVQSLLSRI